MVIKIKKKILLFHNSNFFNGKDLFFFKTMRCYNIFKNKKEKVVFYKKKIIISVKKFYFFCLVF